MSDMASVAQPVQGAGAFRAIVWKELRGGLKPAAIACAFVAVLLLFATLFQNIMSTSGLGGGTSVIPLSLFTLSTAFAGLTIGRGQIRRERAGEDFAFLTHRPVSRSTLFAGKALAGALLYLVAAGLPLAIQAWWLATPGHRPVPFDARMTLADIADLAAGLVYYFAALLFTMREARWFATKFAPIGAALVGSTLVVASTTFGEALGVVALALLVVGEAARGAFVGGGRYEGQSRLSRVALAVTIAIGIRIVAMVAVDLAASRLGGDEPGAGKLEMREYIVATDGRIVQTTSAFRMFPPSKNIVDVRDLQGKSVEAFRDSATKGGALTAGVITTAPVALNPDAEFDRIPWHRSYRGIDAIFTPINTPPTPGVATGIPSSFYFVNRERLIAVYDNRSALQVGWLGPDGLSAGLALPEHRFEGALAPRTEPFFAQPLIVLTNAVYRINLHQRTIHKVFTAADGERVLGAAGSGDSTETIKSYGPGAEFDVIATSKKIYVQSRDGTPQFAVARDPLTTGYGSLTVSRALKAPGAPTFVWYKASQGTLPGMQQYTAADRITELSGADSVGTHYALPTDTTTAPARRPAWAKIVFLGVTQSVVGKAFTAVRERITDGPARKPQPWSKASIVAWLASLAGSLVGALLAFVLAHHHALTNDRRLIWTATGFALGPLGVLLMLALLDWPVTEACPSCGRKRLVTQRACRHCGTPFGAPARDGTEIFEVAAS